jgi:hypothetical protein
VIKSHNAHGGSTIRVSTVWAEEVTDPMSHQARDVR